MAGPTITTVQMGNLHVTTMDFAEVGDQLERHWHQEDSIHVSVIAKGAFRFLGRDAPFPQSVLPNGDQYEIDRTVYAGEVIDWDVKKDHSFIALKANSRLVNIRKF